MFWLRLRSFCRRLFRRPGLEREMVEELEFHLAARADDLMAREGLTPAEALRRARIEFGAVEKHKEDVRRALGFGWIDDLRADLKHALRQLRMTPAFTLTAVAILGLGIGGSTTLFALVEAALLAPLPYPATERLVRIDFSGLADPEALRRFTGGAWEAPERFGDLLSIAGYAFESERLVIAAGGRAELVQAATVTSDFFTVLGVAPLQGPGFVPASSGAQVMLSEGLWRRLFAADSGTAEPAIRIEGDPAWTVAGVMPGDVSFPEDAEAWLFRPASYYDQAIGRLHPGATPDSVRARLEQVFASPAGDAAERLRVEGLHSFVVRRHRAVLLVAFAAVTLVLLVACANVASLVLARNAGRAPELALRAALGARRARLIRLLLSQSLALGLAGGLVGLGLASILAPLLAASGLAPHLESMRLDFAVLGWCALLSVASALAVGLLPALKASRVDLLRSIQSGVFSGEGRGRLQSCLIGAQTAVSVLLVLGALLLSQSLVRLSRAELGFDPAQLVAVEARIPLFRRMAGGEAWYQIANQSEELLRRLESIPGVVAAATTSHAPLAAVPYTTTVTIYDGAESPSPEEPPTALYRQVTPGFFETMGIEIQAGRDFDSSDALTREQHVDFRSTPPRDGVVIVNETMARRHWPDGALGAYLSTSYDRTTTPRRRIVGVVRDTVHQSPGAAPAPELYVPYREDPSFAFTIMLRASVPLETIADDIRRELRVVDPELATANLRRGEDLVGEAIGDSRALTLLMTVFASTTLLLLGAGVHGVLGFAVARRTREIGLRRALGARPRDVRWLLWRRLAPPVGLGVVLGVILGAAATQVFARLVSGVLPGIGPDWSSYAGAALLTIAVTLAAGYLPLRQALNAGLPEVLRRA